MRKVFNCLVDPLFQTHFKKSYTSPLKLTLKAPEKWLDWKTNLSFWGAKKPMFSGLELLVSGANYFPDLVLTKYNPTFFKIQEATCAATPQSIFATSAPETPKETATRWTPSRVINWVMGPLWMVENTWLTDVISPRNLWRNFTLLRTGRVATL